MQEQIKVLVASGASTSSQANFSRVWPHYAAYVGTMSTGTVFGVHVSPDEGTTSFQLMNPSNLQTSTVSNLTYQVGSNVGVGGGYVNMPGGWKSGKIVLTGVVSGGVSFNIIGYDTK